jgi:DNA-binding MarR family transcriptional regulator
MDNKKLGLILIIIGLLIAAIIIFLKFQYDSAVNIIISKTGSCFLEDGTCLHKANNIYYIIGGFISAIIIALGIYIKFFERTQKEIINALEEQKKIKVDEEKFDILMKGLTNEEKIIISKIKEQDGIEQNTLRLRTGLHKSKLSIILGELEKKNLITRKDKGKTKQVFLKIKL